MALVNRNFADIITHTRASTGTYFDSAGVLRTAGVDVHRLDYDPLTLLPRGLLVEEQRTNLLTHSSEFDDAVWIKSGPDARSFAGTGVAPVVTANAGVAPDGTNTATRVVLNLNGGTTSADRSGFYIVTSGIAAVPHSSTIYVKALDATTEGQLLASSIAGLANGGALPVSAITDIGGGWFRLQRVGTPSTATGSWRIQIMGGSGVNDTVDVLLWGAQLEQGSFPTSYIPTTAAQVTRAADVASVNTLSPWYNSAEGTLFVEASQPVIFAQSKSTASLNDGTNASRLTLYRQGAGGVNGYVQPGGLVFPGPIASANVPWRQAMAYSSAHVTYCANGGSLVDNPSTSLNAASFTILAIGNSIPGGTEHLNGHIRSIKYYPRRLTNSELQALTV